MKTTKNDDHPPSETPVPLESESTELRDNIPHGTEAFLVPLPQDLVSPQLTIRAIVTGMLMGSVLSLCNIYAGLKVGWSFNISIIAVLMSYGFWQLMSRHAGARTWTMLENNTSQTTASSAASISSAGLVTAIPALTILTGRALTWGQLAIWTLSVCLVGVFVGAAMRRQMILRDPLPFPAGIATAVTLRDVYSRDDGARSRIRALLMASGLAGAWVLIQQWVLPVNNFYIHFALPFLGRLRDSGVTLFTTAHLGWGIDPSLLLIGTGGLIGFRVAASLFVGTIVAWGILAPIALTSGWADPGELVHGESWYGTTVKWLLWPGVAIMVSASLTSIALSWRSLAGAFHHTHDQKEAQKRGEPDKYGEMASTHVPKSVFAVGMGTALVLSVILQYLFFSIAIWLGVLAVLLTFVLSIVAARVSGITGITPKGSLGKVTQLTFGVLSPGQAATNLMAANVTAGAASQSADILHDLKAGHLLGASPRIQLTGQLFGIVAGSLVGSAAYLLLIPDPETMLLTSEWPAPAVAVWKSVAEVFKDGLGSLPPMALVAGAIGLAFGAFMAILQKVLPAEKRRWLPAPTALGLAFVLPATASTAIFLGGIFFASFSYFSKVKAERYTLAVAAGLIAGESLFGIVSSIISMF